MKRNRDQSNRDQRDRAKRKYVQSTLKEDVHYYFI